MEKFLDAGVAYEIDSVNDDKTATLPRWHLPIHVVEKRGKTRICHDARAAAGGVCLNELLLGGPNLINPLADILVFFRKFRWVFMTDIKSYFHQIKVDKRDVNAFRFPWFASREMKEAMMCALGSHVFGSTASTIVSSYTL